MARVRELLQGRSVSAGAGPVCKLGGAAAGTWIGTVSVYRTQIGMSTKFHGSSLVSGDMSGDMSGDVSGTCGGGPAPPAGWAARPPP